MLTFTGIVTVSGAAPAGAAEAAAASVVAATARTILRMGSPSLRTSGRACATSQPKAPQLPGHAQTTPGHWRLPHPRLSKRRAQPRGRPPEPVRAVGRG